LDDIFERRLGKVLPFSRTHTRQHGSTVDKADIVCYIMLMYKRSFSPVTMQ